MVPAIIEEIEGGSGRGVVQFEAVEVEREGGEGTRKVYIYALSDGIAGVEATKPSLGKKSSVASQGGPRLLFFHHFKFIRNFVAPSDKEGPCPASDPAGYLLWTRGRDSRRMFQFDRVSERHLFLNICVRYAAEFVEAEQRRKRQSMYIDKISSPGLNMDSQTAVVDSIKKRRQRERAASAASVETKRKIAFQMQEQLVEQAIRLKVQAPAQSASCPSLATRK